MKQLRRCVHNKHISAEVGGKSSAQRVAANITDIIKFESEKAHIGAWDYFKLRYEQDGHLSERNQSRGRDATRQG